MNRRSVLLAASAGFLAVGMPAFGQVVKLRRVVYLQPGTQAGFQSLFDTFRAAMKDLGYIEGRDISFEARWGEGRREQFSALVTEVVALRPDVILTASSGAVAALQKATSSIPIVFATAFNPVKQRFVVSLQRPGGNITGITVYPDLAAKLVEIAREALPKAQRLAMLVQTSDPAHTFVLEAFESSTRRFKFEPIVVYVRGAEDIQPVFQQLEERKVDALYLPDLAFSNSYRTQLVDRALRGRIPLFSGNHETTLAGGLISYGTLREENYRRAAALVDKILRGAKPADLPVEQPDRFALLLNRKTVRRIGVTVSPATMLRIDKVIE